MMATYQLIQPLHVIIQQLATPVEATLTLTTLLATQTTATCPLGGEWLPQLGQTDHSQNDTETHWGQLGATR